MKFIMKKFGEGDFTPSHPGRRLVFSVSDELNSALSNYKYLTHQRACDLVLHPTSRS